MSNLTYDLIAEYMADYTEIRDQLNQTQGDIKNLETMLGAVGSTNKSVADSYRRAIENLRKDEHDLLLKRHELAQKYNHQDVMNFLTYYQKIEELDIEIEQTDIDMNRALLEQKKMTLNGINGNEFRDLSEKYYKLANRLKELKKERATWEEKLNGLSNPENGKDVNNGNSSIQPPEIKSNDTANTPTQANDTSTTLDNQSSLSNGTSTTLDNQSAPSNNASTTLDSQSTPSVDVANALDNQSNSTGNTVNTENKVEDKSEDDELSKIIDVANVKNGSRLSIVCDYMKKYNESIEKTNSLSNAIDMHINKLKEELANADPSERNLIEKEIQSIENIKPYATSNGLNRLNVHIDRLKDELANTDSSEKSLIEEYKKSIQESEQLKNSLQNSFETILQKNVKDNKVQLLDSETKIKQTLNKEVKILDIEIEEIDLDIRQNQLNMRKTKDSAEKANLQKEYDKLISKKSDLQDSRIYCKQQLQMFKEKDAKSVENINEILRREDSAHSTPKSNNSESITLDMGDTSVKVEPEVPQNNSQLTDNNNHQPTAHDDKLQNNVKSPKAKKQFTSVFKNVGSWFKTKGSSISTWFSSTFRKKTKALPSAKNDTYKKLYPESYGFDSEDEGCSKPYYLDKDGNKVSQNDFIKNLKNNTPGNNTLNVDTSEQHNYDNKDRDR